MDVTRRTLVQGTVALAAVIAAGSALGRHAPERALADEQESSAHVGVYEEIEFGTYPQYMLGQEDIGPIKWLVVSQANGMKLLMSKYCLSARPYNDVREANYRDITWEESTLRSWLNNEFVKAAFSTDELARICPSHYEADANPTYGTDAGAAAEDKVYILSYSELNEVFGQDASSALAACATGQACKEGAYTDGIGRNCAWWVRTPGSRGMYAVQVRPDGSFDLAGQDITSGSTCVRPAVLLRA